MGDHVWEIRSQQDEPCPIPNKHKCSAADSPANEKTPVCETGRSGIDGRENEE